MNGGTAASDRGVLVTLEGCDGSGKSTQAERLSAWLDGRGIDHLATFEPGGTSLGQSIRRCFLNLDPNSPDGKLEAMLMFADRRHHLQAVIEPALTAGRVVLCDRFTDSTIAYQGYGRGVDLDDLAMLDRWATGGATPDLTLLFDVPPATAAGRAGHGDGRDHNRLDREQAAFFDRVHTGYRQLAARDPERFRVIDAAASVDETSAAAIAALARWLGDRGWDVEQSPGRGNG